MTNSTQKYKLNNLLEPELSYKIQGIFFDVFNKYGNTFKEAIYQKVLEEEFAKHDISFVSQKPITIYSLETGKRIGTYTPDFIIAERIIIEIKAQPQLFRNDEIQLVSYLKASKYEIGYIVNFGNRNLEFKRRIYTNDRKPIRVLV